MATMKVAQISKAGADQLDNVSEIVSAYRRFWVVTIVDGVVFVAKPPKVNDR